MSPPLSVCICCSLELCLIQWAKNEACKRLIKSWKKSNKGLFVASVPLRVM